MNYAFIYILHDPCSDMSYQCSCFIRAIYTGPYRTGFGNDIDRFHFHHWWPLFPSWSSVLIYMIYIYTYTGSIFLYEFCFLWFTNCVLLSDDNSLIPGCSWLYAFVLNSTLILGIWCSTIPHLLGCFLSLDLLSEYWIQHGAIGPLNIISSYSTWIFCRGVSGFATDYPGDVWCHGFTICPLQVGPPFGNRFLNNSWAVGLT